MEITVKLEELYDLIAQKVVEVLDDEWSERRISEYDGRFVAGHVREALLAKLGISVEDYLKG